MALRLICSWVKGVVAIRPRVACPRRRRCWIRRVIMSFGSGVDDGAGSGVGVGEGVEEREGTKIGVDGRDIVVKDKEDEQGKQRRVAGDMGVVEDLLYTWGRPAVAGLEVMYSWRISGAWRSLWLTQESSECR